MTKVLVIGAGFAGCCASHLLSKKGFDITLVEKNSFLGGGCKTLHHYGHPYTFGPRHFLTDEQYLFDFLNQYVPMRKIDQVQENLTFVDNDNKFFSWPPHNDDISSMKDKVKIEKELKSCNDEFIDTDNFEDWVSKSIGETLYSKFFKKYSKKMWQVKSNRQINYLNSGWEDFLGKSKKLKKMQMVDGAKNHYKKRISAFPIKYNGYDDYFDIATENTKVHLNTQIQKFDIENKKVMIENEWHSYDMIISTIAIDDLFERKYGELKWVGREFLKIILPIPHVLPQDVYFLYYATDDPFLRIVEYKKFYKYESNETLIGVEFPSMKNKLYPMPTQEQVNIANKYFKNLPDNVFSIGRAGTYRYLDVDDCIEQCIKLAEKL